MLGGAFETTLDGERGMTREPGSFSFMGLMSALGVTLVLRGVFMSVLGFVGFLILAFYTYGAGPGDPAEGWGWLGKILAGGSIFLFYPFFGALGGFLLTLAGGMIRRLGGMEQWILGWADPAMAEVVRRLALGGEGVPLEAFPERLNDTIRRMEEEMARGDGGLTTGTRRNALRMFRWLVADDMVTRIKEGGESRVTAVTVEKYVRGRVVGWVREWMEEQVELVRYGVYFLWAVMAAFPIYWGLF